MLHEYCIYLFSKACTACVLREYLRFYARANVKVIKSVHLTLMEVQLRESANIELVTL